MRSSKIVETGNHVHQNHVNSHLIMYFARSHYEIIRPEDSKWPAALLSNFHQGVGLFFSLLLVSGIETSRIISFTWGLYLINVTLTEKSIITHSGRSPVLQLLLHVFIKVSFLVSLPTWTGSVGILATPAAVSFFSVAIAISTIL